MSDKGEANTVANWFIAFGIAGAAFLWWATSGFPGVSDIGQEIYAGEWTCWNGGEGGLGRMYGPGLTVASGEVVEAYHFDTFKMQNIPAPFDNVEVISPTKLTLDSTYPVGDYAASFTCEKD